MKKIWFKITDFICLGAVAVFWVGFFFVLPGVLASIVYSGPAILLWELFLRMR